MAKKAIVASVIIILAGAILLNIKVSTRQGINYNVRVYKIPLYVKAMEFITRDYRYRNLASQITKDRRSDTDKALAILAWTRLNIKTDIPEGWPVYDDHIWNIIVRGYGMDDQVNDVFTALCAYAGLPAGWTKIYAPQKEKGLVLSVVKIDKEWRVFDASRGVFFVNSEGRIASTEDIISGNYDKGSGEAVVNDSGLSYNDYFKYMKPYLDDVTVRTSLQMPFRRAVYEAQYLFDWKKRTDDDKVSHMR